MTLSLDSVVLQPGDTVTLRAEVRDSAAAWLYAASVQWISDAESVATTGANGLVQAVRSGVAHVIAKSGRVSDTAVVRVPAVITSIVLSPQVDTIRGLDDRAAFGIEARAGASAGEGRYSAASRSPGVAIASISLARNAVVATPVAPGAAWLVVTEAGGASDSARVVVTSQQVRLQLSTGEFVGYVGRGRTLTASVVGAENEVLSATLTWRSSDANVASVDDSGRVRFLAPGVSVIRAATDAGIGAAAVARVEPSPPLDFQIASLVPGDSLTVGVHQVRDGMTVEASVPPENAIRLQFTDPGLALVTPESTNAGGAFTVTGLRVGSTTLVASAVGSLPESLRVAVLPTAAQVTTEITPGFELARSELAPSVPTLIYVVSRDSRGERRRLDEPLPAAIRSTDTTVLQVDPQDATIELGGPENGAVLIHPRSPGSAFVVAEPAGMGADSLAIRIGSGPRVLLWTARRPFTIGARQISGNDASVHQVYAGTSLGWNRAGTLVVRFDNLRSAVAEAPDSIVLTANAAALPVDVRGLAAGTDTVVATAVGYAPDTLVVLVTTPHLVSRGPVLGVATTAGSASFFLADSTNAQHWAAFADSFELTSSNPGVAVPAGSPRFEAGFAGDYLAGFSPTDTGSFVLTVRDSARLAPALAVPVTVALDNTLALGTSPLALGYRQRTTLEISRGEFSHRPSVLHVSSDDAQVLRSGVDSVVLGLGERFVTIPVIAGTRPGVAVLSVTARGYRPAGVAGRAGPPRLAMEMGGLVRANAGPFPLVVRLLDVLDREAHTDEDVAVTLTAPDGGIVLPPQLTIAAGESRASTTFTPTLPGPRRIVASDPRASGACAPDTIRTPGEAARAVRLGGLDAQSRPTIAIMQVDTLPVHLEPPEATGPVSIAISRVGQNTMPGTPVSVPAGANSAPLQIVGLSRGVDTLVLSATGYASDTVRVEVVDGQVRLEGLTGGSLRVGDSVAVRLRTVGPGGQPRAVATRIEFSLGTSRIIAASGGTPIGAISVAANADASPTFYLKATSTGGGVLVVGSHSYLTLSVAVPTVSGRTQGGP